MRRPNRFGLVFALGLAATLSLASCGEEDAQLLRGETAREITANLDTVEQLADEGDCIGAESAAEQVSAQVETLEGVDGELQRALERGAARLNEVVEGCEEEEAEAIDPASIPETTEGEEEGKDEEKAREKEEKEIEKEEREEESEAEPKGPPAETPPPHSNGQGEGPPSGEEPPESPSGGIGPSSAVEDDEGDD